MRMGVAITVAVSCGVCGAQTTAQGVDGGGVARSGDAPARRFVRIRVVPEDAMLFVDGRRAGNPLDLELPAVGAIPRVEARREGYVTMIANELASTSSLRVEWRMTSAPRRVADPGGSPATRGAGLNPGGLEINRGRIR